MESRKVFFMAQVGFFNDFCDFGEGLNFSELHLKPHRI